MAALTKEGGQKLDCKNFVLMNQLVKKNVNYQVSAMKECWYELYVVSQKASKKTSSHHSKKIYLQYFKPCLKKWSVLIVNRIICGKSKNIPDETKATSKQIY